MATIGPQTAAAATETVVDLLYPDVNIEDLSSPWDRMALRAARDPNNPRFNPEAARRYKEGLAEFIEEWAASDPNVAAIVAEVNREQGAHGQQQSQIPRT